MSDDQDTTKERPRPQDQDSETAQIKTDPETTREKVPEDGQSGGPETGQADGQTDGQADDQTDGQTEEPAESKARENQAEAGPPESETASPEGGGNESGKADAERADQPEPLPETVRLVGVKFRRAGKDYLFNAGPLRFNIGDHVIVETDRGLGLARVVTPIFETEIKKAPRDLKRVIRKANWNDLERDRKNKEREKDAFNMCAERIRERGLNMKMVRVEYLHDASKAIFYFTAEQRVDFRDLVKDLARSLHTRIEMRQIGVRDESKITGGLGPCGREICCSTFLTDFSPVSVRMAKDQNLAMNPTKVSGLCGRLMCCLAYEHPLYRECCRALPKKGKRMVSPHGPCRVLDLNILARKVLIEIESGKTMFVSVDELKTVGEAQAEADACAGLEEGDDLNEEILDSDDPRVLEKMEKREAPSRPARNHRQNRENRPSPPAKPQPQRPAGARPYQKSDRGPQRAEPSRERPGQDKAREKDQRPPDGQRPPDKEGAEPSRAGETGEAGAQQKAPGRSRGRRHKRRRKKNN